MVGLPPSLPLECAPGGLAPSAISADEPHVRARLRADLTSVAYAVVLEAANTEPARVTATVSARNLAIARGGRVVLSVERLDLAAGVTSLVGPNGSGKSTLLHAIAGLLEPSGGALHVLGSEPAAVRPRIAYVLQAQHVPDHLPVTVAEVVALGRAAGLGAFRPLRRADRRAVAVAIEQVGLARLANRHVGDLSGGERQRAFVAQGLAQEADVLLLDEPTAGLDLTSSAQILEVLAHERARGRTIVVATHDLGEARTSDQVVLLAGRVVAAGSPAAVMRREHLAAAYGGRVLDLGGGLLIVDDDAHHHTDDGPAAN